MVNIDMAAKLEPLSRRAWHSHAGRGSREAWRAQCPLPPLVGWTKAAHHCPDTNV